MIEFNDEKNLENQSKHRLALTMAEFFQWHTAVTEKDNRRNYGERRFISTGYIGDRLHVLVWTARNNDLRPISLRKANKRERKAYEKRIS
jgi:hypothetical protein